MYCFCDLYVFQGHDKPGGGFIAGLIAAIPFMIHSMVFGYDYTTKNFRINPRLIAGLGLLLAFISGMFAVFNFEPYMTPVWVEEKLPFIGKLGSPIFFDIGVFFVVFGVVLQITFLLTEE
ncbi:MnhB domain-containing protein [Mangrovivirga cuniculi]|uniref:MnhB domain-containing protein n=1 Tax=Mangrovivirga cuniculi TaxID=2715131 RepID=UPI001FE53218|nr:MnhB domain-containing protein [Mangrovivirga cuniculi]